VESLFLESEKISGIKRLEKLIEIEKITSAINKIFFMNYM